MSDRQTVSDVMDDLDITFEDLLDSAEAEAEDSTEIAFVADMRTKHQQFGEEMFLSDRQFEWLKKIAKENL